MPAADAHEAAVRAENGESAALDRLLRRRATATAAPSAEHVALVRELATPLVVLAQTVQLQSHTFLIALARRVVEKGMPERTSSTWRPLARLCHDFRRRPRADRRDRLRELQQHGRRARGR